MPKNETSNKSVTDLRPGCAIPMPLDPDTPVLCGCHVIRPSSVAMVQQVSAKAPDKPMLFILRVMGIERRDTLFVEFNDLIPLFRHWGIDPKSIKRVRPHSNGQQPSDSPDW